MPTGPERVVLADVDAGPEGARDWYPWVAMGVAFFGTFLAIVNTTTVNVVLPAIGDELGTGAGLEWVVTSYLLAVGSVQPATGWLVDRAGRRRTYAGGLAVFTLGSLLVGLAPTFGMLLASRLVQGMGAGIILPVGLAIVAESFPAERRGAAMGIWGIALMAAPAIGPMLGGWLATSADWRALFLVNAPVGAVGALGAWLLLRDGGGDTGRQLDVVGLLMVAGGVLILLLTLSGAQGHLDAEDALVLLVAAALFALFARRQLAADDPLLDVRMFAIPSFRWALLLGWLLMLAQHSRLFLIPLEMQVLRGATPLEAGLVMVPAAVVTAVLMPVGGRLTDRVGPRGPIVAGMLCMIAGTWSLGHVTTATATSSIVWWQAVQGVGAGLSLLPATLASLNAVPDRLVAQASALRSVNQQLAAAVAVAVLAGIVVASVGTLGPSGAPAAAVQAAYNRGFVVVSASLVAALPLALLLPGRHQNRRVQQTRRDERERQGVAA